MFLVGEMTVFSVKPRFYPIRLLAHMRSNSELTISVTNNCGELLWLECEVIVPEILSLAPDKDVAHGRVRGGIVAPGETGECKCKIYGSPITEPGSHEVKIAVYGYGKDGSLAGKDEKSAELRCERVRP